MTSALRIRSNSPVEDAAELGRRVRDFAADGTSQLARRAGVPHLVEVGRDGTAAAVNDAVDRVTGRRRRSRAVRPAIMVAIFVALGLIALWLVRSDAVVALRAVNDDEDGLDAEVGAGVDQPVDAATLSKATDDGMSHS